jgi:hypothetical protein
MRGLCDLIQAYSPEILSAASDVGIYARLGDRCKGKD